MRTKRKILLGPVLVIGALVLYLALWPVPIDPQAWTPQASPLLTGDYQSNDRHASEIGRAHV